MGQSSVLSKKQSSETWIRDYNHGAYYKNLYGINKVLLLLNEHGDPSFLFQKLSPYNINNQLTKFEKNLSVGSISVEWP